jgi:hypothetical protein
MSFRKGFGVVFVALLGLGVSARAHAQLGVYGMYSVNHISDVHCYAVAPQTCSAANGAVNPTGGMGGIYYGLKTYGPVRLGVDARGGVQHANKSASGSGGGTNATNVNNALGGVRAEVKLPYLWVKPYAEVLAGWARSDAAEPTHVFDNYVQYQGLVGVDLRLLPVLDLRPVEVGIGEMNRTGNGTGPSSLNVRTIGAGVVLHLP